MKNKPTFQIKKEDKEKLTTELVKYFNHEFNYDLSNLEAAMFLDFLDEKISKTYYNQGVLDSLSRLRENIEDLVLLVKEE